MPNNCIAPGFWNDSPVTSTDLLTLPALAWTNSKTPFET